MNDLYGKQKQLTQRCKGAKMQSKKGFLLTALRSLPLCALCVKEFLVYPG
jgi:hypothetical protein